MQEHTLPVIVVVLQLVSLSGVWFEVAFVLKHQTKPALSPVVLILAISSGSAYLLSGINTHPVDYTKIIIGSACVVTCGTNLSQWVATLNRYSLCIVIFAEGALLALLGLSVEFAGPAVTEALTFAPFAFAAAQGGGRVFQILHFRRNPPRGASPVLWCANLALNITLIIYHWSRDEDYWLAANAVSGLFGMVVLLQIVLYRVRGPDGVKAETILRYRPETPGHQIKERA